jgi:hypothetical protein
MILSIIKNYQNSTPQSATALQFLKRHPVFLSGTIIRGIFCHTSKFKIENKKCEIVV